MSWIWICNWFDLFSYMVERVAVTNPEICMDLGKKIKYYEEIKNDVKNLKTTNQLLIKENIKKVSKIGLITSVLGTILGNNTSVRNEL